MGMFWLSKYICLYKICRKRYNRQNGMYTFLKRNVQKKDRLFHSLSFLITVRLYTSNKYIVALMRDNSSD